jgi:hypothetical protein
MTSHPPSASDIAHAAAEYARRQDLDGIDPSAILSADGTRSKRKESDRDSLEQQENVPGKKVKTEGTKDKEVDDGEEAEADL